MTARRWWAMVLLDTLLRFAVCGALAFGVVVLVLLVVLVATGSLPGWLASNWVTVPAVGALASWLDKRLLPQSWGQANWPPP